MSLDCRASGLLSCDRFDHSLLYFSEINTSACVQCPECMVAVQIRFKQFLFDVIIVHVVGINPNPKPVAKLLWP